MTLDPFVDSIDGLPEPVQKEYVKQSDGRYKLDVGEKDGWMLDDTRKLKRTISTLRSEKETLENKLAPLTNSDGETLDIAAAWDAIKKVKAGFDPGKNPKDLDAKIREAVEAHGAQLNEKHKGELASRDDRIAKLSSTVRSFRVEEAILAALMDETGERTKAKAPKLLVPAIREMLRATETDDGDYRVGVIDPERPDQVRISQRQDSDAPMTVSELVDELRKHDVWGQQFEPKKTAGTGDETRRDRNERPGPGPREPGQPAPRTSAVERLKAAHKAAGR